MKIWIVRGSLLLTAAGSIIAVARLSNRLTNTASSLNAYEGISRILFVLLIVFTLAVSAIMLWSFFAKNIERHINRLLEKKSWYWGTVIFLILLLIEAVQDLFFLRAGLKEVYYPQALLVNQDLVFWAAIISGQTLFAWLALGRISGVYELPAWRKTPLWFLAGLVICAVIYLAGGQGSLPPNSPIPFLHLLLITVLLVISWLFFRWLIKRIPVLADFLGKEALAFVILWSAAFFIWVKVPLQVNYFIDAPRPPNYEYSPTSDAIYYESQAQRLLAGEGLDKEAQHSLYSYTIAGLHAIGGDHYLDIYKLQIALLALIPFLIFKLASLLDSRFAGWLMALLVIIREYNALQLGDSITVSNVQELMTEPLATLGVVLFIYLTVLWVKDGTRNWGRPILIGSVVAAIALIRVELLSLVIVFSLTALAVNWRDYRKWLRAGILMAVGLLVVLTPWVVRNYQQTGQITIDKGIVLTQTIQSITDQSGASTGETASILQLSRRLAGRIWSRTFTSLEQTLVYLPSNHFPVGGLDNFIKIVPEREKTVLFENGVFSDVYLTRYVKSLPYWEVRWEGNLAHRSILPQLFMVTLLLIGINRAYNKHHLVGLLPLFVLITHILVYAVVNSSGGRYIQVVDWISLLYLVLGLTALIARIFKVDFHPVPERVQALDRKSAYVKSRWISLGWAASIFLLVLSMPLVEVLVPRQFTETSLNDELREITAESGEEGVSERWGERECQMGKALYPGYFTAREDFGDDRAGRMPETGINQMVFYLVGTRNIWISLPAEEPMSYFPHGTPVVVCGLLARDTPRDLRMRFHPYFLADQVYLLDQ